MDDAEVEPDNAVGFYLIEKRMRKMFTEEIETRHFEMC